MADDNKLGKLIASYRDSKKLTKAELSRRSGVSAPYLTQIEAGTRIPSEAVLRQLAGALGVRNFELLEPAGYKFTGEGFFENYDRGIAEVRDYLYDHNYDLWIYFDDIIRAMPDLARWTASGPATPSGPAGWDELDDKDQRLVQGLIDRLRPADTQD